MSLSTPQGTTEVRLTPEPWSRPAASGADTTDVGVDALGVLTVPDVAKLLRLSEATVWRRVKAGLIESVKDGGSRRVTPAALKAYTESLLDSRLLVTISEAARYLGIGKTKMYELLSSGEIPRVRLGPNATRIAVADLKAYVARKRGG